MIEKKISQEIEREVLIQELYKLQVYENLKGEKIDSLGYRSLVSLLAVKRVIRK